MEDNEVRLLSAIVLAGMIAGEGVTNDDRSVKRAVEVAYKLDEAIHKRKLEKSESPNP